MGGAGEVDRFVDVGGVEEIEKVATPSRQTGAARRRPARAWSLHQPVGTRQLPD